MERRERWILEWMMIQSRIAGHVLGLLFSPAVSALIYLLSLSSVLTVCHRFFATHGHGHEVGHA